MIKKLLFLLPGLMFIFLSCSQEKMLFYPKKLPPQYRFNFNNDFQELFFTVDRGIRIHGLLFRSPSPKGLVFYLHGNAGSLATWGGIAPVYLRNNYDFFILDYRGYGKSQGKITSEPQLYKDIQIVYNSLKKGYSETNIVIIGYSIGTGPAAKLASDNNPKLLILKAPYVSIPDLAQSHASWLPTSVIEYRFPTGKYIAHVKCPIIIFHGQKDKLIYSSSSKKLAKLFKKGDRLILLKGQGHNGINGNIVYQQELEKLLD